MKNKEKHKLRILWNSNGIHCHSGYATQTRAILPRLLKEGYDIAHTAFYGVEGDSIILDGLKIYPKIATQWGEDAMIWHSKDWRADVNVSFQDVWPMDHNIMKDVKRWIAYVPVDQEPAPPAVLQRLSLAWRIVTYSKFGQRELAKKGFYSDMIYHGIDTKVYRPMDKMKNRRDFGIKEDLFVFGLIAANKDNPPRKSFQEILEAFALFRAEHPKSVLFIHTSFDNPNGFPIKSYAKYLGIEDSILHVDKYDAMYKLDDNGMAKMMNCFDCLLSPSMSEGFGLPIVEAQSCGVPVIVTDYSSMPEHVREGKTGFICKVGSKRFTSMKSFWAIPDVKDLYECMEKMFDKKRETMSEACIRNVKNNYDINKIVEKQWIPFFNKVEQDIYGVDSKKKKK